MITTVSEALAAAADILAPYGEELRFSASEYQQWRGMSTRSFCLHIGHAMPARIVSADSYSFENLVTWEEALDKLRATHATVVAEMRAEIAAKAGETGSVR